MIPPKEYFEQVPEGTPGAQRVGPYWFAFVSENALYDMLNAGIFEEPIPPTPEVLRLKEKEEK